MENNTNKIDENYSRNFLITFGTFLLGSLSTFGTFFVAAMAWGESSSLNFLAGTTLLVSSVITVIVLIWFIKSEWGFHLKNLPKLLLKVVLPIFCFLLISYGLLIIW